MSARMSPRAGLAVALLPLVLAVLPAPAHGQPWKPSVTWNSYLGGSAVDELEGVIVNGQNEVFVSGQTNSTDFPGGAGLSASGAKRDALVARLNADGTPLWARVFGGVGEDHAIQMQFVPGSSGQEVYVVGTLETSASGFHTTPTSASPVPLENTYRGGNSDAFLARLNANGDLRWILFLGGSSTDEGLALAVDSSANKVYVGGRTTSSAASFQPAAKGVRGGDYDGFVVQVDVSDADNPTPAWARLIGTTGSFGSNGDDAVYALALQGGAVYAGGVVGSDIEGDDPSIPVIEGFHEGDNDGFVAKLSTAGGVTWFTNLGGASDTDEDEVRDVLAAPNGGLIVVGTTNSANQFPSTNVDVFVVPLNELGRRGDGLRYGGPGNERMEGHASLDALGHVFFGGRTSSATDLVQNAFDGTYETNSPTNSDGYVAMMDAALTRLIWASYAGGAATQDEWVRGMFAGPLGQLTVVGYSDAPTGLLQVANGYDTSANGVSDGFLFRLEVDPTAPEVDRAVAAQASPEGRFNANWKFSDPETGIIDYAWALIENGVRVQDFKSVGTKEFLLASESLPLAPGKDYVVTVRATNGVGRTTEAMSASFSWTPTDAGTVDTPDSGTPGPEPEDGGLQSPLGWGCGSTGGGGIAGTLMVVAFVLLSLRRVRP